MYTSTGHEYLKSEPFLCSQAAINEKEISPPFSCPRTRRRRRKGVMLTERNVYEKKKTEKKKGNGISRREKCV